MTTTASCIDTKQKIDVQKLLTTPSSELSYALQKAQKHLFMFKFDVEKWCNLLSEEGKGNNLTFRTKCFDLKVEEAQALIKYYRHYSLGHNQTKLSSEDMAALQGLEQRIQEIITKDFKGKHVIVRLNSRSPKDTPLFDGLGLKSCNTLKQMYKKELRDLYSNEASFKAMLPAHEQAVAGNVQLNNIQEPVLSLLNQEYVRFWRCAKESLKVNNAKDAMELLGYSERVFSDLLMNLDYPQFYSSKVVIREWDDRLDYDMEFRAFVFDSMLTACCQYDPQCCFDRVVTKKNALAARIQEFFTTKLQPIMMQKAKEQREKGTVDPYGMDYENYVVDFGVLNNDQVVVIEINPGADFERGIEPTGSSLFSYKADRELLLNGPFTFRVVEKPVLTDPEVQVPPEWLRFILDTRAKVMAELIEEKKSSCIIA